MPAILEMPEVRERATGLSVEDYELLVEQGRLGKRVELIRGFIIQKMAKSPLHFTLATRLYNRFRDLLPTGYVARLEGPLRLFDSEPEPDVAVVLGSEYAFLDRHPTTAELVVEVAVSSVALDRENASLFAEAGVKEYWIVLGSERAVEVYRQPENGVYRERLVVGLDATLACESLPAIRIPLADLFA